MPATVYCFMFCTGVCEFLCVGVASSVLGCGDQAETQHTIPATLDKKAADAHLPLWKITIVLELCLWSMSH